MAWALHSSNRHTRPAFLRIFDDFFEGKFETMGKDIYLRHYDTVRSLIPKENLLEYRVQEGWEPICKFLDISVPHFEFPNGNGKEETTQKIKTLVQYEMRKAARNSLWLVGILYVCWAVLDFALLKIRHDYDTFYSSRHLNSTI